MCARAPLRAGPEHPAGARRALRADAAGRHVRQRPRGAQGVRGDGRPAGVPARPSMPTRPSSDLTLLLPRGRRRRRRPRPTRGRARRGATTCWPSWTPWSAWPTSSARSRTWSTCSPRPGSGEAAGLPAPRSATTWSSPARPAPARPPSPGSTASCCAPLGVLPARPAGRGGPRRPGRPLRRPHRAAHQGGLRPGAAAACCSSTRRTP